MATLTVAGVEDILSEYKSAGGSFIKELNLVMPRLFAMGMWRDLVYETTISTTDGNFTLPEDAESVISVLIDNDPAKARSMFHDYRITGRNNDGTTLATYGIIDDGFVPTINELEADKTYKITVEPISPQTTLPDNMGETVTITGLDNSSTPVMKSETITMAGESIITSSTTFTTISEIRNGDSVLPNAIELNAQNTADATDILKMADVQQANHINRYRRYRIGNDLAGTKKTLRVLVKRKFTKLLNYTDPVYPSNLNAIKHALLGSVAEDNADLERASYHWGLCKQLLEDELDAYRGAAKPTINFDPSGSGSRIPNLL